MLSRGSKGDKAGNSTVRITGSLFGEDIFAVVKYRAGKLSGNGWMDVCYWEDAAKCS